MSSARPEKTVLVVFHFAGTPANGMNYRPYYLSRYFLKYGYRPVIIASGYHHQMKKPKNLGSKIKSEVIDGIRYLWLPSRKYNANNSIGRIYNLFSFMLRLLFTDLSPYIEKKDIRTVIASSPSLFTAYNGYRLARKFGARFIFEVRDIWPLSLIDLGNSSPLNPFIFLLQRFENFAYHRCDKTVSLLAGAWQHMKKHGLAKNKFHHISNGIDLSQYKVPPGTNRNKFRKLFKPGSFNVAYCGSMGVANALDSLLAAARLCRDNDKIRFYLVGGGPSLPALKQQATELDNVTFVPSINKFEIPLFLKSVDLCYIGLKKESVFKYGISPTKLFDYMYSGRPVLMSIDTSYNIIKKAGCGITVRAEDPKAVQKGIMELSRMTPARRRKMGSKGRDYVIKNYSYADLAKEYTKLF